MKLAGTVDKHEDTGCDVKVTLTNVLRKHAAEWRQYERNNFYFEVTHARAKSYPIGTVVEIIIRPHP